MYYQRALKYVSSMLLAMTGVLLMGGAFAEDIEIFSDEIPPSKPNILFLLDQSGSMNTQIGSGPDTRISALSAAFNAVVSDPDIKDLSIGLMGFSNQTTVAYSHPSGYNPNSTGANPYPHGISFPVSPIDDEAMPIMLSNLLPASMDDGSTAGYFDLDQDRLPDPAAGDTVRGYLPQILASWTADGATPIVDAYYEAALYFRGEAPVWGSASPEKIQAAHPSSYSGTIVSELSETLTGNTRTCNSPNCGANCTSVIGTGTCSTGETSCYLGTNCTTTTQNWSYSCNEATESDCLASNPAYTSCSAVSYESCTSTCDGDRHPESGACLGSTTSSCNTNSYFNCIIPTEVSSCDRERFQCDEVANNATIVANATYVSPITNQCQSNAIVLLSDGQPFVDNDADTDATRASVKTLIGRATDCAPIAGQVLPETADNSLADGRCGPELAEFLATVDQSDAVDGDNVINTYTVGFGVESNPEAENYLKSLASSGGGSYFPASGTDSLISAFKSIIESVTATARSFAAPVYTVDTDSLLAHSNDIYLPLFENSSLPGWKGNIKKFKLNAAGEIVDRTGALAIDGQGVLKATAVDFWTDTASSVDIDSNPVTSGGFANRIDPSARKLLTENNSGLVALNASNVSKTQLGDAGMADAYRDQLIAYIQGYDADGVTARGEMGDILHSKPTVVSYTNQQVLFFGTNEGYLHAIDASDSSATGSGGTEKFAYMPSALLKNIDGLLKNTELTGPLKRIYGVDGTMTVWVNDKNKNGKVDTADGDTAYLYFGLRRGGSAYYALNISNPDNPSLLWKIDNTGDFSQLGESWSKPVLGKLRYKKSGSVVLEDVLVFGGGYDNRMDEETLSARSALSTTKGNGVYIVNARTGDLIWSYTGGNLQHSVPGNIRVLDMDSNGSIDRLYFGDTGGNIWRVDLNADDVDSDASLYDVVNDARVSKLASLGGSGADYRKFFYEPDVAFFKHNGRYVLVLSIGSGYRSHPMNNTISDRFYVLYDENVLNIPETAPAALTDADLISSVTLAGKDFLTTTHKGWYKDLTVGQGEKVLASAVTFLNKIIFTTFTKTDTVTSTGVGDSCTSLTSTQTQAYVLDLMTASPTVDLDDDGVITAADEYAVISHGDILDSPQLVFNEPSNCTTEGCNQYVDIRVGKSLLPLVDENTVDGNVDLGDFLPKVYWINQ